MDTLQLIRKMTRPRQLVLSVAVALAAYSCALLRGEAESTQAIVFFFFILTAQLGGNFGTAYYRALLDRPAKNPLYDYREEYNYPVNVAREGVKGSLIVSAMIALSIAIFVGWWTLIGFALFFVNLGFYSLSKMPLQRSVWDLLVPFLNFGLLGVGFGASLEFTYDNPHPWAWYYASPALFGGLWMGVIVLTVYLTGWMQTTAEKTHTPADVLNHGKIRAAVFCIGVLFLALVLTFVFTQHVRARYIMSLVGLIPFVVNTYIWWRLRDPEACKDPKMQNLALFNVVLTAVLMLISTVITGDSDRSRIMFI